MHERLFPQSLDRFLSCMFISLSFQSKTFPMFLNYSCLTPANHVFGLEHRVVKLDFEMTRMHFPTVLMPASVYQERGMAPLRWQWRLWSLARCPQSPSWRRLRSWRNSVMISWCSFTLSCLRSPFTSSQSTWAKVDGTHPQSTAAYLHFSLHPKSASYSLVKK